MDRLHHRVASPGLQSSIPIRSVVSFFRVTDSASLTTGFRVFPGLEVSVKKVSLEVHLPTKHAKDTNFRGKGRRVHVSLATEARIRFSDNVLPSPARESFRSFLLLVGSGEITERF